MKHAELEEGSETQYAARAVASQHSSTGATAPRASAGMPTPTAAKRHLQTLAIGIDRPSTRIEGANMRMRLTMDQASKFAQEARLVAVLSALVLLQLVPATRAEAQICGSGGCSNATDPGPRGAPVGAGGYIKGLNSFQKAIEPAMSSFIAEVNVVAGGNSVKRVGLGARFDSNNCVGCHAGVAGTTSSVSGGSSLASNPLFGVYQLMGAKNTMPYFETTTGPTVVARFPYQSDLTTPDGHVHQLLWITGRTDAEGCSIDQPDF